MVHDYNSSIWEVTIISSRPSSATQAVGGHPRIHKILAQTNKIKGLRNSGLLKKPEPPGKAITGNRDGQFPTDRSYVSKLSGSGVLGSSYTHIDPCWS